MPPVPSFKDSGDSHADAKSTLGLANVKCALHCTALQAEMLMDAPMVAEAEAEADSKVNTYNNNVKTNTNSDLL